MNCVRDLTLGGTDGQSRPTVHHNVSVTHARMSTNDMKPKRTNQVAQMRAEYDFDYSKAERGKYYKRLLKEGSNVVVLDRDVAKAFPDSASVNKALRSVLQARGPRRPATRSTRMRAKANATPEKS